MKLSKKADRLVMKKALRKARRRLPSSPLFLPQTLLSGPMFRS
jgi:hypothetical protein